MTREHDWLLNWLNQRTACDLACIVFEFLFFSLFVRTLFLSGIFIWLVRHFTDAPNDVIEPVQHFAQIGPPRNVTVKQADTVYEFVVSWYPPEYGLDTLR